MDLRTLSPAALKAAMQGGTLGWGECGSSSDARYCEPVHDRRHARKCHCGCGARSTHLGMANGVALMSGCEMLVRRWVRNPYDLYHSLRRGATP